MIGINAFMVGCDNKVTGNYGAASSNAPNCLVDGVQSTDCTALSSTYWTDDLGSNVAVVGALTSVIPLGFQDGTNQCQVSDANLVAGNIANGISILGVAGTAGVYGACTDDALNAGQCSTAVNRYVSSTLGSNVSGANGSISSVVPLGFYNGTTSATMSDTNLVAGNIKSGTTIFGVGGSLTPAYAGCSDDALNAGQCSTAAGRYVTGTNGSDVNGADSSLSASIPNGFYSGKSCTMSDTDLTAGNIKSGVNIFGTLGTFTGSFSTSMASGALRDPGSVVNPYITVQNTSSQINLNTEITTYAGADMPTTGGYSYRDVPDQSIDDDGYLGTNCDYAPRPSVSCGTTQGTIAARIADCATLNPTSSTWDGSVKCNRGQGTWKLVARDGANKEVWQDQRTGLIWSSVVSTSVNWCQATGNTQNASVAFKAAYNNAAGTPLTGSGTIGAITGGSSSTNEDIIVTFTSATAFTVSGANCGGGAITAGGLTTTAGSTVTWGRANYCSFTITQGAVNFAVNDKLVVDSDAASTYSCAPGAAAGLQPASPVSYCAEVAGLNAPAGENWGAGTYMAAKGRLGKNATPGVRWRSPSIEDYNIANANGIRFVLPDMGIAGTNRPYIDGSTGSTNYEWSASVRSNLRFSSWYFSGAYGSVSTGNRAFNGLARCVGR